MASKLRRAPLFGLDNPLGISALPKYSGGSKGNARFQCGQSSAPSIPPISSEKLTSLISAPPKNVPLHPGKKSAPMEVASYPAGNRGPVSPRRSSPRSNLHVGFVQPPGEMKERKEKYLTAKYGAHQMSLIRKRLGVEMWMFDQLQQLYPQSQAEGKYEEKEVDLDEILDVDDEPKRRKLLREYLSDCKQPKDKVESFISDILERAKTL